MGGSAPSLCGVVSAVEDDADAGDPELELRAGEPLDRAWARAAPVHELSAHGRRVAARLALAEAGGGPVRPSLWKRLRFAAYGMTHR